LNDISVDHFNEKNSHYNERLAWYKMVLLFFWFLIDATSFSGSWMLSC
jgi:hypothetical protein